MEVGSVNRVNFKATNAFEGFTPPKFTTVPATNNTKVDADSFEDKQNSNVDFYRKNFKDPNWNKQYIPEADIIHMKHQNMIDGTEYEIYRDGKVVQVGTWQNPEVLLEKDEESKKLFDKLGDNTKEFAKNEEKPKTNKFNELVAKVWKFFSATSRMTQATTKGILYGAATGTGLLGGAWLFKALPKAFEKEGPKFVEVFKHPLKHMGKSGKIIAGIGATLVLAYQLIVGKLDTNQRTAVIDHKMNVGHRDK